MENSLENLQSHMTAALFEGAALPAALEMVGAYVGAPIAQMWAAGLDNTVLHSTYTGPVKHDLLDRAEEFRSDNPRMKALAQMPIGQVSRDKDFVTADEIARSPAYQELMIPAGLGHMAALPIIRTDTRYLGLALHRPVSEGAFSDDEAHRFVEAARACAPVFAMMTILEKRNVTIALDAIPASDAAAIITRAGVVIDNNSGFEKLFENGTVARAADKSLQFKTKQATDALNVSLNRPDGTISGKFTALDKTGRRLVCALAPVPQIGHLAHGPAAAMLVVRPLDRPLALDTRLAASVYRLTPAECDVAARMLTGADIKAVAIARGSSPATVRTILKSIMAKTETHTQAGLISRMSQLAR